MIQRVQSLFLFVAFVANCLLFFFPMANYHDAINSKYYIFSLLGLKHIHPDPEPLFSNLFTLPLIITNVAVIALIIVAFISYKKRLHQIRFCRFGIFANIILLILIFFFYASTIEKYTYSKSDYMSHPGIFFPIVSIIFLLLASRAILNDERKVKAADRLR